VFLFTVLGTGRGCWQGLRARLEACGHKLAVPDHPAHGEDRTSPFRVSLAAYGAAVRRAAASLDEPAIVVGHSMGGMAASQAVADSPDLFRAIVYLCAFVPFRATGSSPLRGTGARSQSRLRASRADVGCFPNFGARCSANRLGPSAEAAAGWSASPEPRITAPLVRSMEQGCINGSDLQLSSFGEPHRPA